MQAEGVHLPLWAGPVDASWPATYDGLFRPPTADSTSQAPEPESGTRDHQLPDDSR